MAELITTSPSQDIDPAQAEVEKNQPSQAARETIGEWIRRQNETPHIGADLVIDRTSGAIMTRSEAERLVNGSESGERPERRS